MFVVFLPCEHLKKKKKCIKNEWKDESYGAAQQLKSLPISRRCLLFIDAENGFNLQNGFTGEYAWKKKKKGR